MIISMISDWNRNGYPIIITFVALLILNYYWGNVNVQYYLTWSNILAYIGIGFLYSILRVYIIGRHLSKNEKKRFDLATNVARWWSVAANIIDCMGNWRPIRTCVQRCMEFYRINVFVCI